MRKVLGGIALAAMTAGSALAADVTTPVYKAPPAAVVSAPSWTGFYIGAGLGFRSNDTRVDVTSYKTNVGGSSFDIFAVGCTLGFSCALGEPFNGTAFRFSPYIGYNWQIAPRWVVGIEADWGIGNQTTTLQGNRYPAPSVIFGGAPDSFAVKTTWDASVRARAGFLVDPAVLFYATGGPAWLHVESTSNCSTAAFGSCSPAFGPTVITDSTTKFGFTVGGGIEAMLWPNWVARGEYRYSDFGTINNVDSRACPSGCGGLPFTETVNYGMKVRTHTATFGLAYLFGGPSAAFAGATPLAQRSYAAVPEALSWTGFYLGAGVGVRATTSTATLDSLTQIFPGSAPFDAFTNCTNPKSSGCFFADPLNGTAFRFNPYSGFNWQFAPQWVAGIEGDFGWANEKTTLAGNYAPGTPLTGSFHDANDTFSVKTTWDASLRGRIGYLVTPSLLVYAAAGPAWMHIEQTSTCDTGLYISPSGGGTSVRFGSCTPGLLAPAVINDSTTRLGFNVGGGFEARLWSNWFARGEYRYADFGTVHFTDVRSCAGSVSVTIGNNTTSATCSSTDVSTNSLRVRTHTAMFGLAYKFN